jgi:serine/threonine protein phosphatase PrpC
MLRVSSAAASHAGLRRTDNEDAYCIRPDLGLFVVADGMGGHAAGEIASRLAVKAIESYFDVEPPSPQAQTPSSSSANSRLSAALKLANQRIGEAIADDGALKGMATTAVVVLVGADRPTIAHVGDSRVYRGRHGVWEQLTVDHSWVSEQLRAGVMSQSEAKRHPWRHIVTRALAGGEEPLVDVADLDVEEGDVLLLCSDGLSNVVPEGTMGAIVASAPTLEEACTALVAAANQAGGPDNITVALLKLHVD